MSHLSPPQSLNFSHENLAAACKTRKNEFNFFFQARESDTKPGKVTTSIFLTCRGPKGKKSYCAFAFDSPQNEINQEIVLAKFDAYCQPRKNLTLTQHRFFTCEQVKNQRFDNYVTELRHKAKDSELGDITDTLMQHVLICNIKDSRVKEHLLMQPDFT